MPTTQTLIAFIGVSTVILIAPGPSNLFILAQGVAQGRRLALAAVWGIETAALIRLLITVFGLAALLNSSATVLGAIRYGGAAYLVYLAVQALRSGPGRSSAVPEHSGVDSECSGAGPAHFDAGPERSGAGPAATGTAGLHEVGSGQQLDASGNTTRKALLVGLANPKMIIFYISFLPQFVHAQSGSTSVQILILGAIFWTLGVAWDLALACASGPIGSWIRLRPGAQAVQLRAEALIYLILAAWIVMTGG